MACCASAATLAGPLSNLANNVANNVHKAAGAVRGDAIQRVTAVRLAALHPNSSMAQPPSCPWTHPGPTR